MFLVLFLFVVGCQEEMVPTINKPNQRDYKSTKKIHLQEESKSKKNTPKTSISDSSAFVSIPKGLVDIQTIHPSIRVDLKYASADNFMRIKLYDTLTKAYLQKEVAVRLGKCQDYLSTLDNNLFLLVYDAVRPLSIQRKMWNALDTLPVSQRGKFVSNPANGSIHNYGAAVDITLCNAKGIPLDMGAGYDDIREIAYPSKESYFLSRGELTLQQIENRKLLRKVMANQGFKNIPTEWWHFNAFSRNTAKSKFKPLQ